MDLYENRFLNIAVQELYREFQRCNLDRRLSLDPCFIQVVKTESFWGKWNPVVRTISMAEKLLVEQPWHDVVGVLRHEMAHQYVDEILTHPTETAGAHGPLFQKACEKVGVPSFYSMSKVHLQQNTLDWRQTASSSREEALLEKVRKLLQLAASTSENEATVAMLRVQEIYARYNLQRLTDPSPAVEYYHHFIFTGRLRLHTWEQKIMSLLVKHYNVEVIVGSQFDLASQKHLRVIELIGTRENVLMADYVFAFLVNTISHLARERKKVAAKPVSRKWLTDYQLGLLFGFDDKLSSLKTGETANPVHQELLALSDSGLEKYIAKIHPCLVKMSSRTTIREAGSFSQGKADGQKITLHRPVESQKKSHQVFFLK